MNTPEDTQATADEFASVTTSRFATIHDLMKSPAIIDLVAAERADNDDSDLSDDAASLPARR